MANNVTTSVDQVWQEVFLYTIPSNPSLPSGSAITIDPVLNTEPNVVDSGWIRNGDADSEWTNQSFTISSDTSLDVYVLNAIDDSGTNIENEGFPFLSPGPFEARNIGAQFFGGYFRVVIVNTSGSSATRLSASSKGGSANPMPLVISLDQSVFDQFPAPVTRSVSVGKTPDGNYQNQQVGGFVTLDPAPSPLGISGVYTSQIIDTNLYPTLIMLVTADQASTNEGVTFQWSDTSSFTDIRSSENRTFRTGNINAGLLIPTRTRARYLRIVYENGLTAQGRFYIALQLSPTPLTQEVDFRSTTSGQTGQQDMTLTASRIATGALPNRKSIRIKNRADSSKPVYFGFNAGVTTANGDEIAVGEAVELDVDEFVDIYALVQSTSGGGTRISWTEIGG